LRCLVAATVALAALSTAARGAGFELYEMGTPDLGTASAGRAAMAKDASTVFGNPAGMTKLDRSQILIGIQPIYSDIHFDRGNDTTTTGGSGGNAGGWSPSGGLYYVQSVKPDFKLGFWSSSYFAGSLQYQDNWSGRFYGTKAQILTLASGINAAYKVNDWLSIGGGPLAVYGRLDQRSEVNNLIGPDGELEFQQSDIGFGGMAGIMLEPWVGTRFGVTYISPVNLDFKDVASASRLGPGLQALLSATGLLGAKVDLSFTIPQQVMVSGYHQLTDRLAIMGNLVWQDWSAFGKPDLSVNATTDRSAQVNLDYNDTWGVAVGLQYALTPAWLWSIGTAYDTSPMTKSQRSPNLPLDRQIRVGTGIQYSFNQNVTAGLAYEYMNGGDASFDVHRGPLAGRVEGDYKTNDVHFFNATLIWRF
jgi:long-chain fatty acid transport protein